MSMTLQEAAIKSCEDRIKHLESTPIHHYGKRQRERAIELERVKIAALRPVSREQELEAENKELKERIVNWRKYMTPTREQVEKVWRGEWEEERFAGELEGWQHRECGRHSTEKSMWCPKCGKAMTDKAVGMLMERLETLHSETKTD